MEKSVTTDFAQQLKDATWSDHEVAEYSAYVKALLTGRLPRGSYVELVAQHYFAYQALEAVSAKMETDPLVGEFVAKELLRLPALEHDLAVLVGESWQSTIKPTKPTVLLVDRINEISEWPGGFLAHHYARYLGDLSGGQYIRRSAEKAYGLSERDGVGFYVFDIPDIKKFKENYRAGLNALDIDSQEKDRIIEETRVAYRLNTEVLVDLGRQFTHSQS